MNKATMKIVPLSQFKIFVTGLFIALMPVFAYGQSAGFPSQSYTWKNVTVKGGGFICGIVFNTTQKDLAYIRTDIGSSYKWDSQAKKWIPLTDWCGMGNLHGSESIATDPLDPQRVYIAAGMGPGQAAILRSMDQGKTFQVVNVPFEWEGIRRDAASESVWPLIRTTTIFFTSVPAQPGFGSAKMRR